MTGKENGAEEKERLTAVGAAVSHQSGLWWIVGKFRAPQIY